MQNINNEIEKKINPKHNICWICNKKITINEMITDPAYINQTHFGLQIKPQMNYCKECYKSKFQPETSIVKVGSDNKSTNS